MKYIIYWDAGYGQEHEVVDVEDGEDPVILAYDAWREAAESQADYGVEEYSEEALEEFE